MNKKLFASIATIILTLTACHKNQPPVPTNAAHTLRVASGSLFTYELGEDAYAIVVIQESATPTPKTRNQAYQAAAELTLAKGFQYFVVEKDEQVEVLQTDAPPNEEPNLYQKLIIEKDDSDPLPTAQVRPALRLEIRLYKEKPSRASAVDASRWASTTS